MNLEDKTTELPNASRLAVAQLEREIWSSEKRLEVLRNEYSKRTGHTPPRSLNDPSWKWTIFMTLGFAFISSMVYLLGISKRGDAALYPSIPAFFFETDIAYFAILTFYVLVMVLVVQAHKLSGYQTLALIFGFWCAHWLIYDWSWHAINIGLGATKLDGFWESKFYAPLLIPHPPMWLFLTEAFLGGIMALYTFTIPHNHTHLLPPAIWLYTVYANAGIGESMGLGLGAILATGVTLICVAFGLAGLFTVQRVRRAKPAWAPSTSEFKARFRPGNWGTDPLSLPWVLLIAGMLLLMHLFLVLAPVVGLFLGMLAWFFIPGFYILYRSSEVMRRSKGVQVFAAGALVCILVALVVLMNALS